MKNLQRLVLLFLCISIHQSMNAQDWPELNRFRKKIRV